MKKLFIIGLAIFWGVAVALFAAALVIIETGPGMADKSTATSTAANLYDSSGTMDIELVGKHNTKDDCWLIIDGGVYSVSDYIPFHPGGENTIIPSCGHDASAGFATKGARNEPHSVAAHTLLKKYFVANIGDPWGVASTTPTETEAIAEKTESTASQGDGTAKPVATQKPQSSVPAPVAPVVTSPNTSSGLTAATVATHNIKNDCWLIITGKVYDVTEYIPFHPGGENRIINVCGTDSTTLFTTNSGGGHRHSSGAYKTLAKYLVGDLNTGATVPVAVKAPTAGPDQSYRDAILKKYPGANISKLAIEDDGSAEFKFVWQGESYEGKMSSSYQITKIE